MQKKTVVRASATYKPLAALLLVIAASNAASHAGAINVIGGTGLERVPHTSVNVIGGVGLE